MKKKPLFAPSRVQTGRGSAPAGIPLGGRLRGLLALGLCLCLALGPLPAPALAAGAPTTKWEDNADIAWYSGHESDTEFTLTTAAQLAGLAAKVNAGTDFANKTIRLGANIDLAAHLWKPIGGWDREAGKDRLFNGTFDGGGKTIRGMTVSSTDMFQGLFGKVGTNGTVHSLYIAGAAVSKAAHDNGGTCMGILAGENEGAIYDCAVSGSVEYLDDAVSGSSSYIGGLAGRNTGTVKNCGAQLTKLDGSFGLSNGSGGLNMGGIAAEGTVENCFADADAANVAVTGSGATDKRYRLAPTASYSYWDGTTALTDSSAPNAPSYTQCYEVTAEQIAGTGSSVIGSGSTHAQTPSLVMALNNWTAAQSGGSAYSDWALKNGAPLPKVLVPAYIDIGVIPEQSKESVTGDVNADV